MHLETSEAAGLTPSGLLSTSLHYRRGNPTEGPKMTLPIYTPSHLLARVGRLEKHLPLSGQLKWPAMYDSHKEHWEGWLREYGGPGYYRRTNSNRDAEYIYKHVQNPGMVVWLAEAARVDEGPVRHALLMALNTTGRVATITAAARKPLPWGLVAKHLWSIPKEG